MPLNDPADKQLGHTIEFLSDVSQRLVVEISRKRLALREILNWRKETVLSFPKLIGEPVEIFIDNQIIARGEVVVINDHYGVRISEITHPTDKPNQSRV
jgi:flagellar motor switch protein FliN/FliY